MFKTCEGRLRPGWAFVLSSLLSALAFLAAGYVAEFIAGERYLVFEVIFRVLLAAVIAAIFFWLLTVGDHIHHDHIAAMGLPLRLVGFKQFASGCLIGLALSVVAVVPVFAWGHTNAKLKLTLHGTPRLAGVCIAILVGALAEELMFRGYPFQHLEQSLGAAGAIAVFSVLFGTVHLFNPGASPWGFFNTILIGVVLAGAYLRTRALWLPWGLHVGWNASLGVLFGLPVSGLRTFNVVVRTTTTGPKWLTGGSYGVEASVPGALAILLGMFIVWKLPVESASEFLKQPESKCPRKLPGV